jgi:hypothetical protein
MRQALSISPVCPPPYSGIKGKIPTISVFKDG